MPSLVSTAYNWPHQRQQVRGALGIRLLGVEELCGRVRPTGDFFAPE